MMSLFVASKPLTVSELTVQIKKNLATHFGAICVEGEVSNCKRPTSGHLYFSIKDEEAQLSCVMFKSNVDKLSALPKEGDRLRLFGAIDVYLPRGSYQLIVTTLEFSGLGELLIELERMKKELQALGYFNQELKKALPLFPKKIGLVTSPTGAVLHDILHILKKRARQFHLLVNPVRVQGEGAAEEIALAIEQFAAMEVDVIIVARGGGSVEDLWAFNERLVVEAIYQSKIPMISAVGHEVDFTLADFVADVRAPTPSAAAHLVVQETSYLEGILEHAKAQILATLRFIYKENKARLLGLLSHPLLKASQSLLFPFQQKIDELSIQIFNGLIQLLQQKSHQLALAEEKLQSKQLASQLLVFQQTLSTYQLRLKEKGIASIEKRKTALQKADQISQLQLESYLQSLQQKSAQLEKGQLNLKKKGQELLLAKKEQLVARQRQLSQLHPKAILERGYAIVYAQKDQSIIVSAQEIKEKQGVILAMKDGRALATIKEVER